MTDTGLTKEKHPQHDLFICDVSDAVLKDFMQEMEHPVYSLSKKPVCVERQYTYGKNSLTITPSIDGLPTIYDKDLLIYVISQLIAKKNAGHPISKRVELNTYDLLVFTNRGTGGKDYKAFEQALKRLRGVTISTNIVTGNEEQIDVFGLIDKGSIRRKYGTSGRLISVSMVLSDWVFNAIDANEVLTLNRDYFRLGKPIERRLYEIARKHCGQQKEWSISVDKLMIKSGSQASKGEFKRSLKQLSATNHLPDYTMELVTDPDSSDSKVVFKNRKEWWDKDDTPYPKLNLETFNTARAIAPDGSDIYAIEQDWREYWKKKGKPALTNPDKAFLGFISKKYLPHD